MDTRSGRVPLYAPSALSPFRDVFASASAWTCGGGGNRWELHTLQRELQTASAQDGPSPTARAVQRAERRP